MQPDRVQLIHYATPEPRQTGNTREIVFACITLAIGVGYGIASATLGVLVVAMIQQEQAFLGAAVCGALALLLGLASFGVVRASWRVVQGLRMTYREADETLETATPAGCAVGLTVLLHMIASLTAVTVSVIFVMDCLWRGLALEPFVVLTLSIMLTVAGALVLRLRI
jgi:hypothetical protein